MRSPVRLGAVSYLNVRPLVYGLDAHPDLLTLRFDVPAECARLLDRGAIDLGMIPSIVYLHRPDDRIVPDVCIASNGPVASVVLFARVPVEKIRSIALDTSSRTSAVLTRILCRRRFGIEPVFTSHGPDLETMLSTSDAALLIGDNALFADAARHDAMAIDLGETWTAMTGLPFVWAFWSGRASAADQHIVSLLRTAASDGAANLESVAQTYCVGKPERVEAAVTYLRDNLVFTFDERAMRGLSLYYDEARLLRLVDAPAPFLRFF